MGEARDQVFPRPVRGCGLCDSSCEFLERPFRALDSCGLDTQGVCPGLELGRTAGAGIEVVIWVRFFVLHNLLLPALPRPRAPGLFRRSQGARRHADQTTRQDGALVPPDERDRQAIETKLLSAEFADLDFGIPVVTI
jgi:hypothetical protein